MQEPIALPNPPAPKSGNGNCVTWILGGILLFVLMCFTCLGFYALGSVIAETTTLVDYDFNPDVIEVAPAGSPASPADETDIPNLPRGESEKFSCGPEDEGIVYVIGGKLIGNTGVEGIGSMSLTYARTGAPLQPFFSQVTDQDFENRTNIRIKANEEIFNDFGQFFVYCENETWKAVKVGRDDNDVWFGDLSYVEANYDSGILYWVLCNNDSGNPGTFTGTGSTCRNYTSTTLASLYTDGDFQPYITVFEEVWSYGTTTNMPSNGKIELYVLFPK